MAASAKVDATVEAVAAAVLPAGFREQVVFGGLNQPVNIEFAADGRLFVAEKAGRIKVFDNLADPTPTTFVDLSAIVDTQVDRGLLGLALHPQFPTQPWVYVLYTYDAPPGQNAPVWNDNCSSVGGSGSGRCVVTGRLSRLQAAGNVMTGTEQVLIRDWCQQYPSHSVGDVQFGFDGALYASGGDGASYSATDYGQLVGALNPCADPPGGSMSPPGAQGGALRSQDVRTLADPTGLNGALLRLDPVTGAAAAGNPLATSADLNARRIVAYGLRNPYRFAIRPGTSEVWLGDVGWRDWEEIDRRVSPTAAATNFGWPCYEGAGRQPAYDAANLSLCEGLYSAGGHTGPYYAYHHSSKVVAGESCATGTSAVSGMAFYPTSGGDYPAAYRGALFFADYARACVWAMLPATAGGLPSPSMRQTFVTGAATPVDLEIGPGGDLYYADIGGGTIRRIRYFAGNQPPTAVLVASPTSGTPPLTVRFDASSSTDPDPADAGLLRYEWDFTDDGTVDATAVTASYTYPAGGPYRARLRVIDSAGASDTQTVDIQSGNTPPAAVIDSPAAGLTWDVGDTVSFAGHASDEQQGQLPASALHWRLLLHHCYTPTNCHAHTVQDWQGVASGLFIAPDHEYPSRLELVLTATDSGGLSQVSRVQLDPRTVSLTFDSNPPGLQVAVGSTAQATPFTRTVIQGSANSVSAVTPQTVSSGTYAFAGWSDGGAQTHLVTAPATATTYTALFARHRLPRTALSVRYVDSQETLAGNYRGINVLDGNATTIWHTLYSTADPPPPHEIQLDLGATYMVTHLYYLPRRDHTNGRIARYEVYVSNTAGTWGSPAATGTFADGSAEQVAAFPGKAGRYVRLRALSEVRGNPWTAVAELNVGVAPRLSTTGMTVRFVDSQETTAGNYRGTNVLDGSPATIWHTAYSTVEPDPPPPHEIQIDMGRSATVSCLFYLPRQDSTNGRIARYAIYTSTDGTTWGSPAATGTWANSTAEQQACFPTRTARYLRLVALSEVSGRPWNAVAELTIGGA